MNYFIDEFVCNLQKVDSESDLRRLYQWLFNNQPSISETSLLLNSSLRLTGEHTLQPDLPCISVGSVKGFVILAANPGWNIETNAIEDSFCRTSAEAYEEFIFDFFGKYPSVVKKYSKWWNNALSKASHILPNGKVLLQGNGPARWKNASNNDCVGGWELFPWHSSKDGISNQIQKNKWLLNFASESIRTLIRLKPKTIFVASKSGHQLIRHQLLMDIPWQDGRLGNSKGTTISYARLDSGTEIIAIGIQIFANVHRDFKDVEMYSIIEKFRNSVTSN